MAKRILITGGAGFIGSNLACFLKGALKNHEIICMDNLVRAGSEINAARLKKSGVIFKKGDVRKKNDLLRFSRIDTIIDCCAEPSVLAGFDDPVYTIDTNLIGTINCLELAKKEKCHMIFLSTSRVYPIRLINDIPYDEKDSRFDYKEDAKGVGYSFDGISEEFNLNGVRSLYGATKMASEHLIHEYIDIFGIRAVINRFGVIAGPWQMGRIDQGLIGYWIARHLYGGTLKFIGYKGSGKQLRDVLHVDDLCELVLYEMLHMKELNSLVFNVGGGRNRTFSLLELTGLARKITGRTMDITPILEPRRADVRIYITDNGYVSKLTGWKPKRSLGDVVEDTYQWMKENKDQLQEVLGT